MLFLKPFNYDEWLKNVKLTDKGELNDKKESADKEEFTEVPPIPPLEGDEEEGKALKILTPNKLLTRLPIVLAQIKAGNNSSKLKNQIRQILYLLYQNNKITKNVCNNLIKSL